MRSEQASKLANKLGDLIRQHRTLHYTQSTFAKMIGVSRSTVQKREPIGCLNIKQCVNSSNNHFLSATIGNSAIT